MALFTSTVDMVTFLWSELEPEETLQEKRITRILTTDFPQYFALVTRVKQEAAVIGYEGGVLSSTVVPQVQAVLPEGTLTKPIKVGLQVRGLDVSELLVDVILLFVSLCSGVSVQVGHGNLGKWWNGNKKFPSLKMFSNLHFMSKVMKKGHEVSEKRWTCLLHRKWSDFVD